MSEENPWRGLKTTPLYDASSFIGRFRHFAAIANPFLSFTPTPQLYAAKELLERVEGSTGRDVPVAEVRSARVLYQSAFHPDSGELQNVFGRMSFQVPGGTMLIGAMLVFYKSSGAVVFWQWANQSFNALVNYTNRNADSPLTTAQIGTAYASATTAALGVSLGLKRALGSSSGMAGRLVPLAATLAANCVNIPLMRRQELTNGLRLQDESGSPLAVTSTTAGAKAVGLVTASRCAIVAPPMLLVPAAVTRIEKAAWFRRSPGVANIVTQVGLSAALMCVTVPSGCALFPQRSFVTGADLQAKEPRAFQKLNDQWPNARMEDLAKQRFYFNKGL